MRRKGEGRKGGGGQLPGHLVPWAQGYYCFGDNVLEDGWIIRKEWHNVVEKTEPISRDHVQLFRNGKKRKFGFGLFYKYREGLKLPDTVNLGSHRAGRPQKHLQGT